MGDKIAIADLPDDVWTFHAASRRAPDGGFVTAGGRVLHVVAQGDRPDLLAYRYYRDPLKFWRIADANRVLTANELVAQPGDRILVPPDTQ